MTNVVSFTYLPIDGRVPLTVDFTDTSHTVPTGTDTILTWHWDFGDGYVSALPNPTHVYTAMGSYNASLSVVWASFGPQGPTTHVVSVSPAAAPPGPTPPPPPAVVSVDQYIALIIPEHNAGGPAPVPPPPLGYMRIQEGNDIVVAMGGPVSSFQAFDPAVLGTNVILSNGDKTVSCTTTNTNGGTRSITSYSGTAKRYAEFTYENKGTPANGDTMWVGISDSGITGSDRVGLHTSSTGYFLNFFDVQGLIFADGSQINSGPNFDIGDVMGIAVDLGLAKIDFYKNNVFIASSDFTGTGDTYLCVSVQTADSSLLSGTMNFGSSPFVYTPPAGYTAGW